MIVAVKPRLTSAPSYRSKTSSSITIQFRQFTNTKDEGDGPVTKYQIQIKKDTEPDRTQNQMTGEWLKLPQIMITQ